jgi:hypothetical protein
VVGASLCCQDRLDSVASARLCNDQRIAPAISATKGTNESYLSSIEDIQPHGDFTIRAKKTIWETFLQKVPTEVKISKEEMGDLSRLVFDKLLSIRVDNNRYRNYRFLSILIDNNNIITYLDSIFVPSYVQWPPLKYVVVNIRLPVPY